MVTLIYSHIFTALNIIFSKRLIDEKINVTYDERMKFLTAFLLLFYLITLPQASESDDWFDDDVDIKIVSAESQKNISYFEEHFSGYTFSTYSLGNEVKRFIFEARIRYQEKPMPGTTVLAEYRYQNSQFDTPVEDNSTGEQSNKKFSYNLSEFRELYIDQRISDYLSFRGGRQIVVWGQWSTFSPIDLLLPFDFAVIGPAFNKEQIKQPMKTYSLSYNPNKNIQFDMYYFPEFTLDYSSLEALDYAEENGDTVTYPSKSNDNQYALRYTYTEPNYSYGITYFKGFEVLRNQYSQLESYNSALNALDVSYEYLFPKKDAIVLEANRKLGANETIGIEFLIQSRKMSYDNLDNDYFYLSGSQKDLADTYLSWIQNENDGLFYATQYMFIPSIGYQKVMGNHLVNISLSYIKLLNPKKTQDGLDLYNDIGVSSDSDDWTQTYQFLGSFSYLYYLDSMKTQSVGTMLGFLGSGVGGSVFYGASLYETVTFGIGLEYIKYLSDMSFGTTSEGESIVNVDELSIRTGFQYLF
ncbi:MAG: hypothetical protein VXX85_06060 [Candidatus Margulisiibacteriota bacterium]|nr:hypothetical protein [Candidatus Margulisiibacteriota bacterium]